jgi:hypothetical protein
MLEHPLGCLGDVIIRAIGFWLDAGLFRGTHYMKQMNGRACSPGELAHASKRAHARSREIERQKNPARRKPRYFGDARPVPPGRDPAGCKGRHIGGRQSQRILHFAFLLSGVAMARLNVEFWS